MSCNRAARLERSVTVALVVLAGTSGLAWGQQKKESPKSEKGESIKAEMIEGVILKVEKVAKGESPDSRTEEKSTKGESRVLLRLSINTNDVWRDWARDQASTEDNGSPTKDAAKGENSIATKGQPVDENSLVVVEVLSGTRVETRFRSPTDETSEGEKTPEKVKSDEATPSKTKSKGKPVQFRAEDLKPGLFVEARFSEAGSESKNRASTVTVIRPIRVIDSGSKAQPPSK
ncbi:hypothetical protein P12x_005936 (plasmid) [Tundrisphaera lichenicola]|uniref:hypothetical protein n=1 Tax=Tundrisphaera lichenicola TaxID=2029860 RepID=UPI003EBFE29D